MQIREDQRDRTGPAGRLRTLLEVMGHVPKRTNAGDR
jgi:hypothetical protein